MCMPGSWARWQMRRVGLRQRDAIPDEGSGVQGGAAPAGDLFAVRAQVAGTHSTGPVPDTYPSPPSIRVFAAPSSTSRKPLKKTKRLSDCAGRPLNASRTGIPVRQPARPPDHAPATSSITSRHESAAARTRQAICKDRPRWQRSRKTSGNDRSVLCHETRGRFGRASVRERPSPISSQRQVPERLESTAVRPAPPPRDAPGHNDALRD
jgi:hypothetical protein